MTTDVTAEKTKGRGRAPGSAAHHFTPSLPADYKTAVSRVTADSAALDWWGSLTAQQRGQHVAQLHAQQKKRGRPAKVKPAQESQDSDVTAERKPRRKVTRS